MPSALPSVGVCAHPYDAGYSPAKVVAALRKVGITRVRADCPWSASDGTLAWCTALAKAGVTLCLSVNGWEGRGNVDAALGYMRQILAAHPGSIDATEGPNEVNNDPQTWAAHRDPKSGDMGQRSAAHAVQSYLYQAMKADPVLKAIPVVSYTDITAPSVIGAADFANMHVYDNRANGPLDWWLAVDGLGKLKRADPNMPWYVTEWGVRSDTGNSEALQARYILQGILTHIQMGTSAHYLYELFDDNAGAYGLFKADGRPKASAAMMAGVLQLLSGASPIAGPAINFDKATTGDLGSVQHLALQTRGGVLVFFWTWNPPAKPFDLYWSLDQAVRVTGIDIPSAKPCSSWSKRPSGRQDWRGWDGSPFVLRYSAKR